MTDEIRFLNLEEIADEYEKHVEELAKKIYVDGDVITINVAYEYYVELHRCASYEHILAWVLHLSEKNWMTGDVMERFIELALQHNKLDRPSSP